VGLLALAAPGCSDGGSPTATEPTLASISVTPAQASLVAIGATLQLQASARDTEGGAMNGLAFTWSSADPGIAEVNSGGMVTAVTPGVVQIRAEAEGHGGTATITVTQEIASVDVTPGSFELVSLDETHQLSADVHDATGHAVTGAEVVWSSSDPSVVEVDASGVVTARGVGSAEVIASAGGMEARSTVVVDPVPAFIAFVEAPQGVRAGEVLAEPIEVGIYDALGSIVADATLEVAVALGTNPEQGTLSGLTRVAAVDGVADFTGLSIDRAGIGYTLRATASSLPAAESDAFDIGPCAAGTPALPNVLCVIDPSLDGPIDITRMVMRFSNQGHYEITLIADPARPFQGTFRVNLNMYAPDIFAFFQDVVNDFDLAVPDTELTLQGFAPVLNFWLPGTRVYLHSLDGTPNPPGTTLYRSAVNTLVNGQIAGEDTLAFARRWLPAVVY
jgi:hypothetical protein